MEALRQAIEGDTAIDVDFLDTQERQLNEMTSNWAQRPSYPFRYRVKPIRETLLRHRLSVVDDSICSMTSSITDAWPRIETWLAQYAPVTYASLAPPADPTALAATERVIGMPLPGPLAESLLLHDGTDFQTLFPSGWYLLSAEDIARTWALRTEIAGSDVDDIPDDPTSEFGPWWNRLWIPFASFGNGDHLVIDQFGRIGDACHETAPALAPIRCGPHFQSCSPMSPRPWKPATDSTTTSALSTVTESWTGTSSDHFS